MKNSEEKKNLHITVNLSSNMKNKSRIQKLNIKQLKEQIHELNNKKNSKKIN